MYSGCARSTSRPDRLIRNWANFGSCGGNAPFLPTVDTVKPPQRCVRQGRSLAWQTSPRSLTSIRFGNLGEGVNGADHSIITQFHPRAYFIGSQSTRQTGQTGRTSWRSLLRVWQGAIYRVNVKSGTGAVPESSLECPCGKSAYVPGSTACWGRRWTPQLGAPKDHYYGGAVDFSSRSQDPPLLVIHIGVLELADEPADQPASARARSSRVQQTDHS